MRAGPWSIGIGLCSACWPLLAGAATPIPTTASFSVNAVVSTGCLVVSNPTQVSGIQFGTVNFGSQSAVSGASATAWLGASGGSMAQVQCTSGATVTITFDAGQNALGSQRRLKYGSNHYLPYNLYTSASMATSYAPGVGVPLDTTQGATSLPVYGRATPPASGLPAGQYTDTVQVVLSW